MHVTSRGRHDAPLALTQRAIRTTNLLERLFVEERRRLKIILNAFGGKAVLKLIYGAMIRGAERWRCLRVTEFESRQLCAVIEELNRKYEAASGIKPTLAMTPSPRELSSNIEP